MARTPGHMVLRRLMKLEALLLDGKRRTSGVLAEELECSLRTVKRDIDELRDFYQAQIEWDSRKRGYVMIKRAVFPVLHVAVDEALALLFAQGVLQSWQGSPLAEALQSILEKVAAQAGEFITVPLESLQQCLFNPEAQRSERRRPLLADIALASQQGREVRILYRKPGYEPEWRKVQPLKLAYLEREWVLVAHDLGRHAFRNFRLDRVEQMETTDRTFTKPSQSKIEKHLKGAFGRFAGDQLHHVRLAFDALAEPHVIERPWHTSQSTRRSEDSRLEVRLAINHLADVQRAVLSWGGHVEVLEPKELRKSVAEQAGELLQQHQKSPRSATP
jgi:predicted DNA-binding transcriptional regulator YafY